MSFSFLSDAYPGYKNETSTGTTKLFEDFGVVGGSNKQPLNDDSDLLLQEPKHPKSSSGMPEAFDASSDYFKILASEWVEEKPNAVVETLESKSSKSGCMDVAEHLDDCSACRIRLEQIFRKMLAKPIDKPVIAEPQPPKDPNRHGWLLEIAMLMILGIFIVFVLDAFVRLGRYFTKSR